MTIEAVEPAMSEADAIVDMVAALREPRKILHRRGITLRMPRRPERMHPVAWSYSALWIVGHTLADNGLVERSSFHNARDEPVTPSKWRWKHEALRRWPHSAVGKLVDWLEGEWGRSGLVLVSGNKWFLDQVTSGAVDPLSALINVRNSMAKFAGLIPSDNFRKPPHPAIRDYVFALDQALDRIFDTVREMLVRAWFEGRLTDEQKADFVKVLETAYERGQWDGDVDKLAARVIGAPVVQLRPDPEAA